MNYEYVQLRRGKFLIYCVFMLIFLLSCGQSDSSKTTTESVKLREGLGLSEDEGWIVLARPNSLWTVGTVIEKQLNREAKDIGTLTSLKCFPESAWLVTLGIGPQVQYGQTIEYGLSISASLGLPKTQLVNANLNFGGDGKEPSHKTTVILNKVSEQRVDMLKAEEYLEANFNAMSSACQRNLLDATRFIVDKILVIEDGELNVVETGGTKIDLSLPKYQFIQDAALKSGYSVTKEGSIKIANNKPVTLAIRQADFGKILERMNIQRRGMSNLRVELQNSGEAIKY